MERGFFISVEGGEGVGKSTFVEAFVKAIKALSESPKYNHEISVVQTREPGGTAIGNAIRAIFATPPQGESLTPQAEAMLVMAARAQHVARLIRPALDAGKIIVCDRFFDSTFVYQGIIGRLDGDWLKSANRFATDGLMPDLTVLLDCPVEISITRSESRAKSGCSNDGATRYDAATREQHEQIRNGFLECARSSPERFIVLDALNPVATMVDDAIAVVVTRFLDRDRFKLGRLKSES